MTEDESEFVEAVAALLGSWGLPPMAGRMWAYLLICEPTEQTAGQISEALHASRGAISGTARMLTTAGFIRRVRRRGDRREFFSAPPDAFDALMGDAARTYATFRKTVEIGLNALADRPPSASERLKRLHHAFAFMEHEVPLLVERYLRERDGAPSKSARKSATESTRP
jgi:DNA-binding transcriptional regulator GbsR (MarR family)